MNTNEETTTTSWSSLGLDDRLLETIAARGYETPTPVQVQAVPPGVAGKDLLVRSKTGTGKTAAFMIPAIARIPDGYRKPGCIVLAPTRELAIQTADEARLLSENRDISVVAVYGGVKIGPQTDALDAGAEIVVGTPGRVADHIRRGNLKLADAVVGVLDEADEMLSMGFLKEVTDILLELPDDAQILLFSATVEQRLKDLIGRFLKEPEEIYLSLDTDRTVDHIDHVLYETTIDYPKPRQLLHVIEVENPESAIVFCNTRSDTDLVARFLNRQGLVAEPISSDLNQKARERVMARIKRGEIDYLIATDIAARGIDISDLTHVFNYTLPEDPAIYLHRTGRTGRIGKKGTAISFMGGRELSTRGVLRREYQIEFEERTLPSREEADALWTERHIGEMRKAVNDGLAFEGFLGMAKSLRERGEGADALIAIALRGFFRWHRLEASRRKLEEAGEDPDEVARLMAERKPRGGGGRPGGGGRGGGRGGGGRGGGGGGRGRRGSR
jgi:ATP-dependent RNA helicase DeaD